MTEHPDYFKKDNTGQVKTPFSGDVAELNYENEKVQEEMSRVLLNIASFGFDGVRCDMAHLIPVPFWSMSINRIKSEYANFEWIAEAYSNSVLDLRTQTDLMNAGFDAIYDEPLYRNLKTEKQVERMENFMGHYSYVFANSPKKWVHYLMNHDDNFPLDSEYFWTWFQLISFLPGWIFQYNGNLWGRTQRLAHHWIEILPEEQTLVEALDESILSWYKWFNVERPIITSIETDSFVKITWKGVSGTGCYSFRLNSESLL
jgi:glycosidase